MDTLQKDLHRCMVVYPVYLATYLLGQKYFKLQRKMTPKFYEGQDSFLEV
jgi:hypothetical protein